MTAPDRGLTDLLAAHRYMSVVGRPYGQDKALHRCTCLEWEGERWADHPAHVALVVEQHMQGQTARVAELEAKCVHLLGRNEHLVARRRVNTAMLRGAQARAEKAEAELEKYHAEERRELEWERNRARDDVRCPSCNLRYGERDEYGCMEPARAHYYDEDELRAALEGEQR